MFIHRRKGIVGFVLTMAVGIAIGAAALVVSNELTREERKKKIEHLESLRRPSSSAAVQAAFEDYQKAYLEYQQAVGLGRPDVDKYLGTFNLAKRKLEIEIFRNTPGVSEMDMEEFLNSEKSD